MIISTILLYVSSFEEMEINACDPLHQLCPDDKRQCSFVTISVKTKLMTRSTLFIFTANCMLHTYFLISYLFSRKIRLIVGIAPLTAIKISQNTKADCLMEFYKTVNPCFHNPFSHEMCCCSCVFVRLYCRLPCQKTYYFNTFQGESFNNIKPPVIECGRQS